MNKCDKLLEKAKNSSKNLSFIEVIYLAECHGFEYKRTTGCTLYTSIRLCWLITIEI